MGDFQSDFTIILICMMSTIIIWKLYKSSRDDTHLPPTPFRLPIIGHLHLLAPSAHRAFHKLSIRYGPVFRIYLGSTPCVIISSPEMAKEFFKVNENAFLDRPNNPTIDYISYGGEGFIFRPYGSYWKFMKKITMSHLLNGKTLDILLPVRRDEINHFIKYLSQKAKVGKSVELDEELGKLTSNVISRMVTGKRCSEEEDEVKDIMKIMSDVDKLFGKFNLSDHIWLCKNLDLQGITKRSMDLRRRFNVLMERILKEHEETRKQKMETEEVKDFLNILLDISEDESMEIKLTRENIKAFILATLAKSLVETSHNSNQEIFLGATDTTARTIEWAFAELINHPNIMKKAVEEIDRVVGKNRLLQESDITNLPYLQEIVKETLRLHPAGPVLYRRSREDCTVGGYHIPAKTTTFFNLWSLGQDPTYWESPLEFRPERFEEKQIDVRGQHFNLLPFGSGRRMCPGISLGLMMVHVTLGSMIQCFTWKAGKYGNRTSVDMEEGIGITLPRANPLVCVAVARLDPLPLST